MTENIQIEKESYESVIGEASESDDESNAVKDISWSVNKTTVHPFMVNIEADVISSLSDMLRETQKNIVSTLNASNQLLFDAENNLQKIDYSLKSIKSTSDTIKSRLRDAVSLKFVPDLFFK